MELVERYYHVDMHQLDDLDFFQTNNRTRKRLMRRAYKDSKKEAEERGIDFKELDVVYVVRGECISRDENGKDIFPPIYGRYLRKKPGSLTLFLHKGLPPIELTEQQYSESSFLKKYRDVGFFDDVQWKAIKQNSYLQGWWVVYDLKMKSRFDFQDFYEAWRYFITMPKLTYPKG